MAMITNEYNTINTIKRLVERDYLNDSFVSDVYEVQKRIAQTIFLMINVFSFIF